MLANPNPSQHSRTRRHNGEAPVSCEVCLAEVLEYLRAVEPILATQYRLTRKREVLQLQAFNTKLYRALLRHINNAGEPAQPKE